MNERDAVEELSALKTLADSKGWKLFMAEFSTRFEELTSEQQSLKTPRDEAESLRQARGRIEERFQPDEILENLITKLGGQADRQIRQVSAPPPK